MICQNQSIVNVVDLNNLSLSSYLDSVSRSLKSVPFVLCTARSNISNSLLRKMELIKSFPNTNFCPDQLRAVFHLVPKKPRLRIHQICAYIKDARKTI